MTTSENIELAQSFLDFYRANAQAFPNPRTHKGIYYLSSDQITSLQFLIDKNIDQYAAIYAEHLFNNFINQIPMTGQQWLNPTPLVQELIDLQHAFKHSDALAEAKTLCQTNTDCTISQICQTFDWLGNLAESYTIDLFGSETVTVPDNAHIYNCYDGVGSIASLIYTTPIISVIPTIIRVNIATANAEKQIIGVAFFDRDTHGWVLASNRTPLNDRHILTVSARGLGYDLDMYRGHVRWHDEDKNIAIEKLTGNQFAQVYTELLVEIIRGKKFNQIISYTNYLLPINLDNTSGLNAFTPANNTILETHKEFLPLLSKYLTNSMVLHTRPQEHWHMPRLTQLQQKIIDHYADDINYLQLETRLRRRYALNASTEFNALKGLRYVGAEMVGTIDDFAEFFYEAGRYELHNNVVNNMFADDDTTQIRDAIKWFCDLCEKNKQFLKDRCAEVYAAYLEADKDMETFHTLNPYPAIQLITRKSEIKYKGYVWSPYCMARLDLSSAYFTRYYFNDKGVIDEDSSSSCNIFFYFRPTDIEDVIELFGSTKCPKSKIPDALLFWQDVRNLYDHEFDCIAKEEDKRAYDPCCTLCSPIQYTRRHRSPRHEAIQVIAEQASNIPATETCSDALSWLIPMSKKTAHKLSKPYLDAD